MSNDLKNSSILFICHESSRTGAPMVLLNLLRWLKDHAEFKYWILINKGGELDGDFRALAPTLILSPKIKKKTFRGILRKFRFRSTSLKRIRKFLPERITLVYSNTIANGELTQYIRKHYHAKVITHLHEMQGVIKSLGMKNLSCVLENTDLFIAASCRVKEEFAENHRVPENKFKVIHEFITPVELPGEILNGLPDEINNKKVFVVGSVGFVDYRKGFDIFLQVADLIINVHRMRDVRFLWVGEFGHGREKIIEQFLVKHSLKNYVFFTGPADNPSGYYGIFDLFFLASREDPFPLVMLESARHSIPVLAFRQSGGVTEFINENSGILLDDFDIQLAAFSILKYSENKEILKKMGANAKLRFLENFTTDKQAPAIYAEISNLTLMTESMGKR